jgi:hypothetical protein
LAVRAEILPVRGHFVLGRGSSLVGERVQAFPGENAMQVEMRPVGSIQPYENIPRDNDAGVDAVAAAGSRSTP